MSEAMAGGYETDTVTRLETNLDDCPAEILGAVMEMLLTAGALDVWFTPIQMKKHRPGVMLSVLCTPAESSRCAEIIFRETTAFGLRKDQVERLKLARRVESVSTRFGPILVKVGSTPAGISKAAPEFESCRAASARTGQPLREVYAAAMRAHARLGKPAAS